MSMKDIQAKIAVGKNSTNTFGNQYKYRTLDAILEVAKPIVHALGYYIRITDEAVLVGTWNYQKATVEIVKSAGSGPLDGERIIGSSTAFAREQEIKKGFTADQITGSASTYARKNAATALFALDLSDEAADPDSNAHDEQQANAPEVEGAPIRQPLQYILTDINAAKMEGLIKSGQKTPERIISNLEMAAVVSDEIKTQIMNMVN